jgi:hypothetical protein
MMKRHCLFKRPGRGACRANVTAGSEFCFFHDPDRAADREAAQRAGGLRNKAVSLSTDTPDCDLRSAGAVITLLGTTINQVRRGQIDPRISNAIGYLAATLLKALEIGNLEQRLSDLEMTTRKPPQSDSTFDTEVFQFITAQTNDQPKTTDQH